MDKLLQQVLDEVFRLSSSEQLGEFEEYEGLTELRQKMVEQVEQNKRLLTVDQKKIIQQILSYDSTIMSRMEKLKREAEEGMKRLNASRKLKAAYGDKGMVESFMYDQKN